MAEKTKVPFHRDPRMRSLFIQIALPALVIWGLYTLYSNLTYNLAQRNKTISFDFLDQVAPFKIGFYPFWDFKLGESIYWEIFIIGIQNTLLVSVMGIVAATILGFIIGVMRLSPNWLVSKFALVYIETMRNVPLLLQIIFWNFAIFLPSLPYPRQSLSVGDAVFFNNRGAYLPVPEFNTATGVIIVLGFLIAAIIGSVILTRWAKRRQDETGQSFPAKILGFGIVVLSLIVAFFVAGDAITTDYPKLSGFNFTGGFEVPLQLFSLWFALTTYTAAFIAENVRGGIQAVSHGQTEAAQSLGISRVKMLQKVIIPQAMRVIIPPTISQYLNLTKNSSLAVAVGYEEIVAIFMGIALNQTGQEIAIIIMTMGVYITLSLLTSLSLNLYNRSVQLVER